jgi:arginine deiminase
MVFTLLDTHTCMVFEPVIMQTHHYDTVHIHVEGGQVVSIREEDNLLTALAGLGMDLEPLYCGGRTDSWVQEREQWHSGANFFALAPGQVVGYGRNSRTIDELSGAGYEVVSAADVIAGRADLDRMGKCVITVDGSELARGGGGCRCMTMPIGREAVSA